MTAARGEPLVTFTAKELLADLTEKVTAGFARMEAKLDNKADKADVESLRADVRRMGERTADLESWRLSTTSANRKADETERSASERRNLRIQVALVALTAVMALGSILVLIIR